MGLDNKQSGSYIACRHRQLACLATVGVTLGAEFKVKLNS